MKKITTYIFIAVMSIGAAFAGPADDLAGSYMTRYELNLSMAERLLDNMDYFLDRAEAGTITEEEKRRALRQSKLMLKIGNKIQDQAEELRFYRDKMPTVFKKIEEHMAGPNNYEERGYIIIQRSLKMSARIKRLSRKGFQF